MSEESELQRKRKEAFAGVFSLCFAVLIIAATVKLVILILGI